MKMNDEIVRSKEFFENKSKELEVKIKELQYDLAELQKHNSELLERCKKLGSRQPVWPRGYRPQRYTHKNASR